MRRAPQVGARPLPRALGHEERQPSDGAASHQRRLRTGGGLFRSATGQVKHYESTDHVEHPSDARLTTDDFLDLLAEHTLARDHECEAGSVFHLASAIAGMGIVGITAVGDTAAEADAVFERARVALDAESAGLAR